MLVIDLFKGDSLLYTLKKKKKKVNPLKVRDDFCPETVFCFGGI